MSEDLSKRRYGKLVVERFSYRDPANRKSYWLCRCDCGREKIIVHSSLKNKTRSCGCTARAMLARRNTKHGLCGTRTHRCWRSMVGRVTCKTSKDYEYYSKLGIDPRWRVFANFLADMGKAPTSAHTIDRKDNKRGYWLDNCRWATRRTQSRNRRPSSEWRRKQK